MEGFNNSFGESEKKTQTHNNYREPMLCDFYGVYIAKRILVFTLLTISRTL